MTAGRGVLTGERVRLRAVALEDLDRLVESRNDEQVLVTARLDAAGPVSRTEGEAWVRDPGPDVLVRFAIVAHDRDRVAGTVTLEGHERVSRVARLGIQLHPDSRGRGLGTDAVRTVVRYAFDQLNLRRVWLGVQDDQAVALGCYGKAGFVEEGRLRDEVWRDGAWHDLVIMSVLQHEWRG
ncbi:MAG: GNAT family N-acetyltransferase [Actinobacteria bacterium]|nr:GNAT family N-acetyltransferase [Actinomycetota bacterium]